MMPQMTYSSATSPLGRDTCKALITIFRNLCLDTFISLQTTLLSFPGGSADKESACDAGDPLSIPGLGRSSGEGNCNPLQYSCLENLMDRGDWQATVHGVAKSLTQVSG